MTDRERRPPSLSRSTLLEESRAGVDGVLGYHLNPLTCGVAKFNLMLARRLQVPMLGLFDSRGATLRHPLLSLKLSEFTETDIAALVAAVETAAWSRRFSVFLHAWTDTPVEQLLLSRAARVFCGFCQLECRRGTVAVCRATEDTDSRRRVKPIPS